MAARTGEQFLRGLAGRRDLWVGGDKVSSVVDHPALAKAYSAILASAAQYAEPVIGRAFARPVGCCALKLGPCRENSLSARRF